MKYVYMLLVFKLLNQSLKQPSWEFPGASVVRFQHFPHQGPGSVPGRGAKITQAVWPSIKIQDKRPGVTTQSRSWHKESARLHSAVPLVGPLTFTHLPSQWGGGSV